MKKIIFILSLIIILSSNVVHADGEDVDIQIEFDFVRTVEELREMATDIVHLEVLDERGEWINLWPDGNGPTERSPYELFTISNARILNVFQGSLTVGEVIEVRQLGGNLEGVTWTTNALANFSNGDEVILFLGLAASGHYGIFFPMQSIFVVGNDGELSSYHTMNDLVLTWDYLNQIQHDNGIEPANTNEAESNYSEEYNDRETSPSPTTVENSNMKKIGIIVTGTILIALLIILTIRNRNRKKDE